MITLLIQISRANQHYDHSLFNEFEQWDFADTLLVEHPDSLFIAGCHDCELEEVIWGLELQALEIRNGFKEQEINAQVYFSVAALIKFTHQSKEGLQLLHETGLLKGIKLGHDLFLDGGHLMDRYSLQPRRKANELKIESRYSKFLMN